MLKTLKLALLSGLAATLLTAAPVLAQTSVTATLRADKPGPRIEPEVYGQFAEHLGRGIYEGVWVGEDSKIPNTRGYRNDVVAALKALKVPMMRWPGGCFADDYHWREGIGPRDKRPVKVNVSWGGVEETNAFGTHEFMDFAELIGAKAYVAGNVGNGTPQEMAEWVEYLTQLSQDRYLRYRLGMGNYELAKANTLEAHIEARAQAYQRTVAHLPAIRQSKATFNAGVRAKAKLSLPGL